jgi:molybdopterin adenylyltransferase
MDKIQKTKIVAVSVSKKKGTKKTNVPCMTLKEGFGIIGDAHAGAKKKQVSLLAVESIEKMKAKGLKVVPGDFAENITTKGLILSGLGIGDRLRLGKDAIIEISQIGKRCRARCAIYYQVGDCVMPREGIFGRVLKGGSIKPGDQIKVVEDV